MEFFHVPESARIDLGMYIARHSADQLVVYKYVNQVPLYLAFFFPPAYNPSKKYPAFVFIHGGAWESRKIFEDQNCWQGDYLGFLARYYSEKGFLSICIDYRLVRNNGQTSGYGLIDSCEDCCDAMNYVQTNAGTYGIDTDRIYLLGESAGGHLAACVSTLHYKKEYVFKTVFLINSITDMNDPHWNSYVPKQSNHILLAPLSFSERTVLLSPLYQIDEHTSPTVLIHGNHDTCVDKKHSEAFYRRMCAESRSCDLHLLADTDHAFLLAEFTNNINPCKTGIQIINSYLPL